MSTIDVALLKFVFQQKNVSLIRPVFQLQNAGLTKIASAFKPRLQLVISLRTMRPMLSRMRPLSHAFPNNTTMPSLNCMRPMLLVYQRSNTRPALINPRPADRTLMPKFASSFCGDLSRFWITPPSRHARLCLMR